MRLCIPVTDQKGLQTEVFGHFGSAPYFLIFDTTTRNVEFVDNQDQGHVHGMCHPLRSLENQNIDAVVCGGMGARAIEKLNEGGLKAYRAADETAQEIINKYENNLLEEITTENACRDHHCH